MNCGAHCRCRQPQPEETVTEASTMLGMPEPVRPDGTEPAAALPPEVTERPIHDVES